ncbi:SMP-30/gluconolactonase/LRE family protein [Actinomadura alba]|uniref:SMP-30/gluconolactonase/LRE family protein n=1 Tax=Actinomadura alba TaxID=406431 RepID=A0ABR7LTC9_9ACTN|nr:SMP-30/gluconolactonase/LRE family protein [Actinomadura alba]MBC6468092.1 SMP-30/gluconolactonase/LRE family protein [Actinomadura alba]
MATVCPAELIGVDATLDRVATGFVFTEGPVWVPASGSLLFSDLRGSKRYRWDPVAGVSVVCEETNKGNGMVLGADGRLVVCEHVTSMVVAMDADGTGRGREVLASHYQGMELNSPNDVTLGPDGMLWFTDPPAGRRNDVSGLRRDPELDFQAVFRLDPESGPEPMADGFELCNGLAFAPDGSRLYVTDTYAAKIWMYLVTADGRLGAREQFCDLGPLDMEVGWGDGVRCDEHGNVWSTGPHGIWVLDPQGVRLGLVEVPEPAANLTWGGDDGHTLFVTASTSLYAVRTEVAGHRPAVRDDGGVKGVR